MTEDLLWYARRGEYTLCVGGEPGHFDYDISVLETGEIVYSSDVVFSCREDAISSGLSKLEELS